MHDFFKEIAPLLTVALPFFAGLLTWHESHKKSKREEYDSLIQHYKDEADSNYKKWKDAEREVDELRKQLEEKDDNE